MIRYRITHVTEYRYTASVPQCQNEAHLLPRATPQQKCEHGQLRIEPLPAVCQDREDFFGNRVTYFAIQEPHASLSVTAQSEVLIVPTALPRLQVSPAWEEVCHSVSKDTSRAGVEARQFLLDSPLVHSNAELASYAATSFVPNRPLLEAVADLVQRIYQEFTYEPEATTVSTPLNEVIDHRQGVCQDFAHVAIGCLRTQGIATRYVSGYLETAVSDGQPQLAGAAASHAWVSVYCPGQGWIDFDPTNNSIPTDQHITVAWGRDYSDVTPLKGVVVGGGSPILAVAVTAERVPESGPQ